MPKVTIELDYETVDKILVQELQAQYDSLKEDLERRKDDLEPYGFFSTDKEEDIVEIQRHIDAFKTVVSYNMTRNDFERWINEQDSIWE